MSDTANRNRSLPRPRYPAGTIDPTTGERIGGRYMSDSAIMEQDMQQKAAGIASYAVGSVPSSMVRSNAQQNVAGKMSDNKQETEAQRASNVRDSLLLQSINSSLLRIDQNISKIAGGNTNQSNRVTGGNGMGNIGGIGGFLGNLMMGNTAAVRMAVLSVASTFAKQVFSKLPIIGPLLLVAMNIEGAAEEYQQNGLGAAIQSLISGIGSDLTFGLISKDAISAKIDEIKNTISEWYTTAVDNLSNLLSGVVSPVRDFFNFLRQVTGENTNNLQRVLNQSRDQLAATSSRESRQENELERQNIEETIRQQNPEASEDAISNLVEEQVSTNLRSELNIQQTAPTINEINQPQQREQRISQEISNLDDMFRTVSNYPAEYLRVRSIATQLNKARNDLSEIKRIYQQQIITPEDVQSVGALTNDYLQIIRSLRSGGEAFLRNTTNAGSLVNEYTGNQPDYSNLTPSQQATIDELIANAVVSNQSLTEEERAVAANNQTQAAGAEQFNPETSASTLEVVDRLRANNLVPIPDNRTAAISQTSEPQITVVPVPVPQPQAAVNPQQTSQNQGGAPSVPSIATRAPSAPIRLSDVPYSMAALGGHPI